MAGQNSGSNFARNLPRLSCQSSSCIGGAGQLVRRLSGLSGIVCRSFDVIKENPQNVPEVEMVPNPDLTARQAVEAQMKAISRNDSPWTNHGIHAMYEFCYDAGSMERSRFFGFSKDLYHVDHFMGAIANYCGEIINCTSYVIGEERQAPGGCVGFEVEVTAVNGSKATFDFVLQRQEWGLRKGSWQTKSLTCSGKHQPS